MLAARGGEAPVLLREDGPGFCRRLAPYESVMLEEGTAGAAEDLQTVRVRIPETMRLRLETPNLLRLGQWRLAILDKAGNETDAAEVAAEPLAAQLSSGGLRFAPRVEQHFGIPARFSLPRLRLAYSATFENGYEGSVRLLMEPGSLEGAWRIFVNGSQPLTESDFAGTSAHVPGLLGVEITQSLKPGTNTIRVELETDRPDGGLLQALYLAGEFGAGLSPLTIQPLGVSARFGAYEENGLPFFSGRLLYSARFDLEAVPSTESVRVVLDPPATLLEACEVSLNGSPFVPCLWEPRQIVVPASTLRRGGNEIAIRVFTGLLRAFEGERFDPQTHESLPIVPEPSGER